MSSPSLFVVDAFTDVAFRGNPAGVVLLERPADPAWMQSLATELRFSETAFVTPPEDGVRGLRWFTPKVEVDLCGHATLAAAHVLRGRSEFETRSGRLSCVADEEGWVRMDFPADHPTCLPEPPALRGALRCPEPVAVAQGVSDLLVELASASDVRNLDPDIQALSEFAVRGVIVTAADGREADIVSRCFYPAVGVPEDPVTGSAHCTLASWWCPKLGKAEIFAIQASPRGGRLRVALDGARVHLAGRAVTVIEGAVLV